MKQKLVVRDANSEWLRIEAKEMLVLRALHEILSHPQVPADGFLASILARRSGLSIQKTTAALRNLERQGFVNRSIGRPCYWGLTGRGWDYFE